MVASITLISSALNFLVNKRTILMQPNSCHVKDTTGIEGLSSKLVVVARDSAHLLPIQDVTISNLCFETGHLSQGFHRSRHSLRANAKQYLEKTQLLSSLVKLSL
jgi:hypothetical protein